MPIETQAPEAPVQKTVGPETTSLDDRLAAKFGFGDEAPADDAGGDEQGGDDDQGEQGDQGDGGDDPDALNADDVGDDGEGQGDDSGDDGEYETSSTTGRRSG